MQIITNISAMQSLADQLRSEKKRIAVVPTMGYLHEGHLSLVRLAKQHADVVIMTIFVNPLQFAPGEDFERYPRDLERDRRLAEEAGAEVIFAPSAEEMYPEGFKTFVEVDQLSRILEGEFRPTHFRGVTTVVSKLFNCTKPHVAVFGQKDAQQAAIIKQMVRDLNFDIEILVGPIVREPDGLAMSSRNVYLSEIERVEARVLSEALHFARVRILNGERNVIALQSAMQSMIIQKPSAKIDYIAFVYPETFAPVEKLQSGDRVLIALAVRIGTTRLIDNDIVDVP